MADIFVSYARADKARVAPLVAALERQGWSVWWDPAITPGQEFNDLIAEEIDKAEAVLVVWTPASVTSRWVRGEAQLGAERGVLVPVRFNKARLPIDALSLHTTDLDAWNEDPKSAPFQELLGALSRHLKNAAKPAPGREHQLSVCVLPFVNMSDDREQEYFADGISEDIITDLSKVSALAVVARNTAFTFKGKSVDIKQVARQIEVSHVLEGSVRKSGSKVRITAQLIDGASGNHVWAERYDRNLDDIFALQDEISEAIVAALKLNLLPEEKKAIEDRGTSNAEAYDLFLRGRAIASRGSAEEYARAVELFRRAHVLDPGWPEPIGNLVGTLMDYATFAPELREKLLKEAEAARNELVALFPENDPIRNFGVGVGGSLLDPPPHDYALIVQFAESSPPEVHLWAMTQATEAVCRFNECADFTIELRRKDPLSLVLSFVLQSRLDNAGRASEAWTEYERSRDLQGNRGHIELLAFFRMRGRPATEIEAQYRRFLASRGLDQSEPHYEALLPILFDASAAEPVLKRVFENPEPQGWAQLTWLAFFAAWFGLNDIALAALRRDQIELISPTHRYLWHPILAETRKDPRFKQLVRDLGLYDYWRGSGKWGDFARPLGEDDFEIVR